MDKKLTAKRLRKRHNRHAASDLNWAPFTKPDLRTPESIRAKRKSRSETKAKRIAASAV